MVATMVTARCIEQDDSKNEVMHEITLVNGKTITLLAKDPHDAIKRFIDANETEKGGYKKQFLESIGVEWPPRQGWKKDLC